MAKKLPTIRIYTDKPENSEKVEALFQSMVNRVFNYHLIVGQGQEFNADRETDIDLFYSTQRTFIQDKISEISTKKRIVSKAVIFICNKVPQNLSLISALKKPVVDFIMLPADRSYLQFKIEQAMKFARLDHPTGTEKLLTIQHKIEYHNWFQSDLESSMKYLLSTLSEIDWVDGGGIYFFTPDNNALALASHFGLSGDFIQRNETFPPKSPQVNVVKKKKFFFGSFEKLLEQFEQTSNTEKILAIAILPLIHNGEAIGCINLASKTKEEIPKNDQMALETIASKIATIISFLKAFDELKKAKAQLEKKVHRSNKELEKTNQVLQQEINFHKNTRESLSLSENLYRSIFNYANDGIVLYDANSLKPFDVNPKAHNDLGYTRDEFMNLKTSDFTIYESKEYQQHVIAQLFQNNRVEYYVKHKSKSNEIKYRVVSANIITINNKKYILGIVHDITRLRLAEFEIQQKEKRIKSLQENISIGLFRTDQTGTIIYANNPLAGLIKAPGPDAVTGKKLDDFVADPNVINQVTRIFTKHDIIKNFELQILDKSGKRFWVLLNLKKVKNSKNEILYYDGSIEDIAALKNTQLKLEKANQKITKINKSLEEKIIRAIQNEKIQQSFIVQKSKLESLGELAAGIAHEINQPLGIMSLAFENLQSRLQTGIASKDYINKKIASILLNIDRIRDIINHIRIFSREQESFDMQKVNVNKVVLDVIKLIKTQYQNHNITLTLDLHKKPGFTIGSMLKMEQVLLNLLSNAKYAVDENEFNSGEGYSKTIAIKTDVHDNRIYLMLEDNGIGIDAEHLNKIFDPFYTTKPEWVGTGLGLSITYGIIKDMHGSIVVESKPKKFTRFHILLPRFPEKD